MSDLQLPDEHFRLAVEAAPSGMLMVDRYGTIVLVNRQLEQQFGYHRDELIGQSMELLVPARFASAHSADRERYLKLASARPMGKGRDLYGVRKDGSEFPVEIGLNPVHTNEGTVVLASVVDITERKRAEEEFRVAVEASPNGMLMVDATGSIRLVNAQIEYIFGYAREELLGKPIEMLLPHDVRDKHKAYRAAFLNQPESRRMGAGRELYGLRKNGSEFPLEIGLNPIRTTGGVRVLASVVDITERKRAEEQFRVAVEGAPHGILMVDEDGTILLVNAQIEKQFGYSRQELLGQAVEILVPESFRATHSSDRAEFYRKPELRQMGTGRELFGVRKDGQLISVEIGLNPIRTASGLRVLASIVDITERRRIEDQLRRTKLLAELGTLASGMAHEIGTPMNVILGRAEFAMQRTGDEPMKRSLETIVRQVERITKIMNQFLAFARRRPAELRSIALRGIIEDALEMLHERLAHHHIEVASEVPDDLPALWADPDQMTQVLLNLFINALQAMPSGGTLRVSAQHRTDTVALMIGDTGHGISRDNLNKIFTPFYTTKDVGKGTGLGLTIVHSIIEEHGGSIAVESGPGQGTTFTIVLPIKHPPENTKDS
jgi:PAS domain S-box-containing protein